MKVPQMTAPAVNNLYPYYSKTSINLKMWQSICDADMRAYVIFTQISTCLKKPNNFKGQLSDKWHDPRFVLEITIAEVDFNKLKNSFHKRVYLPMLQLLVDMRAIRKVNDNRKCWKYYVNPDYINYFDYTLSKATGLNQAMLYEQHHASLWAEQGSL